MAGAAVRADIIGGDDEFLAATGEQGQALAQVFRGCRLDQDIVGAAVDDLTDCLLVGVVDHDHGDDKRIVAHFAVAHLVDQVGQLAFWQAGLANQQVDTAFFEGFLGILQVAGFDNLPAAQLFQDTQKFFSDADFWLNQDDPDLAKNVDPRHVSVPFALIKCR